MISNLQIYTMFLLRNCKDDNAFQIMPPELILEISVYTNDKIAKALHHAAYARQEDVNALIAMLEDDPTLLLQAGDVVMPSGDRIKRVTPFELLLGVGDYELASIVKPYFLRIENGEKSMSYQYERYRPSIEGMTTKPGYDLAPLIELIKKSTDEEVQELETQELVGESDLCKAMIQFRKDWAPRVFDKPCMYYNYVSLLQAFKLLQNECSNLWGSSNHCSYKVDFVWRQLIGFQMRRLPGIDRCIIAQGVYPIIIKHEALKRSYAFRRMLSFVPCRVETFPLTITDELIDGLGWRYAVNSFGVTSDSWMQKLYYHPDFGAVRSSKFMGGIGALLLNKSVGLQQLMAPCEQATNRCVIS